MLQLYTDKELGLKFDKTKKVPSMLKSKAKDQFPNLEDIVLNNKSAQANDKRKKSFKFKRFS